MSEADRRHWDLRHSDFGMAGEDDVGPPKALAAFEDLFPTKGLALDIACGRGAGSVWLARRGMEVLGVDVSTVAIDMARRLAELVDVTDRCSFRVHDLDRGLPDSPLVDLILCHKFRDPGLDRPMVERLAPGGVLAIVALCQEGNGTRPFRVRPGELKEAFDRLEVFADDEGGGVARLIGRRRE